MSTSTGRDWARRLRNPHQQAGACNLPASVLYEHAIRRSEGLVAADGPLVCRTGAHTGRSPNDKFVVQEPSSEGNVWWGKVNRPMQQAHYDALRAEVVAHLGQQELYVQDLYAGADPAYRLSVRFVQELAWQNLFVRNLFIVPPAADLAGFQPQFTVLTAPSFKADPARHGSRSDVVIAVNLATREVIIAGTSYAGENKKSIFTVLNYVLPLQGVLSMHCSANIGQGGDTALFFGLSGTGKTTLSSDPDRRLIGDDEHGWSDRGVFNFEGGCYAKMIKLSAEAEPQIFGTTRRFGTVLENVVIDPVTRALNFDDGSLTENTRGAYPIEFIDNAVLEGVGGHPENIIMLTADAYGVLPPIARLSPEGAMYHYLSGYTAKVAGTEKGVTEPSATFSTCFGAPFLPLNPNVYAKQLGERIAKSPVEGVAREHRVDRRAVRRRQAHEDCPYAGDDPRRALRRARSGELSAASGVQHRHADQLRRRAVGSARSARHLERQGGLRPAGGQARGDVRRELQDLRGARRAGVKDAGPRV